MSRRPVIVAGCLHGGLSVIRSLGRRRIAVYGMSEDPTAFGLRSRFLAGVLLCPGPDDPRAVADFMLELPRELDGALVIDTTDSFALALSAHADELGTRFRLATPARELLETFIDKERTHELAERYGVPSPGAVRPDLAGDGLEVALQALRPPWLVKPTHSHEFVKAFGVKAFPAETVDEARRAARRASDAGHQVILQELIPGPEARTMELVQLYRSSSGTILAECFSTKLRQAPPTRGVMRAGMATPVLSEARELASRLLESVSYRGYADVEFMRDPRDGVLRLIEVNARIARNNALALASGVDFAWLMYRDLVDGVEERVEGYWMASYVDVLSDLGNTLLREGVRRHGPRDLVRPYAARRRALDPWAPDDPKPFLALLGATARGSLVGA